MEAKALENNPIAYREEVVESLVRMYKVLALAKENVSAATKAAQHESEYSKKALTQAHTIYYCQLEIVAMYEMDATSIEISQAKNYLLK